MPQFTDQPYDYVILGGGASGLTVARFLSEAGSSVIVLEQGRRLPQGVTLSQAEASWEKALIAGQPHRTGTPWSACALGGGTVFFAGIAFRYREVDFYPQPYLANDTLAADWPISYCELRPWYDEMERVLGVARALGADPHEPPGARPPLPANSYDARGRRLADAAEQLGLRPFPTPLAINSRPYAGYGACAGLTPCAEHQCPLGAKADAVSRLLDTVSTQRPLIVQTDAKAVRLALADSTRVGHVEWLDLAQRRRRVTRARRFILAANAVQSAALLLRSAQPGAPTGLGNSSGLVGAGLSFKISGYVEGRSTTDPRKLQAPGPHSTVALTDHYLTPACLGGLGGVIYQANPIDADDQSTLRLHFLLGDQPLAKNKVLLSPEHDDLGLNYVSLSYRTHPRDAERLRFLATEAARILRGAGITEPRFQPSGFRFGSRHLHGTCRAGLDPTTSVADRDGRLHDLDNVFVVDGSYIPFAGGVNPVLTIQANALRVAAALEGLRAPSQATEHAVP
jgi:choline dehydrogenase-like flavoprotein